MKYIRAAVRWGKRKARFLDHDYLDGTGVPRYESNGVAYTEEEIEAISGVAQGIDPRFWAAWEIATDTGRRIGAIRRLVVEDLDFEDGVAAINFPAATDKARRQGRAYVTDETKAAIEALLELDAVLESGYLFPQGRLTHRDRRNGPIGDTGLNKMLKKAEEAAGVDHVEGRGFHGVKRRAVTMLMDAFGGDAGKVGQITGNLTPSVLEGVYRQVTEKTHREALEIARRARKKRK